MKRSSCHWISKLACRKKKTLLWPEKYKTYSDLVVKVNQHLGLVQTREKQNSYNGRANLALPWTVRSFAHSPAAPPLFNNREWANARQPRKKWSCTSDGARHGSCSTRSHFPGWDLFCATVVRGVRVRNCTVIRPGVYRA